MGILNHFFGYVAAGLCLMVTSGSGGVITVKTSGIGKVKAVLTYTIKNNEVTITGCNKDVAGKLVIPETIEELPVVTIGDEAFHLCGGLASVILPKTLTKIGRTAFHHCKISDLVIPPSVTSIGPYAFRDTHLERLDLPVGVTVIRDTAFGGCGQLGRVSLHEGLTKIENHAFGGCSKLTQIELPAGLTSIGFNAFGGCKFLESIEIPNGVSRIEKITFASCLSLEEVRIGSGVRSIGSNAFKDCSILGSIYFAGEAPEVVEDTFSFQAKKGFETRALVQPQHAESFGGVGADWNGLVVTIAKDDPMRDGVIVETPKFSMPDSIELKATGHEGLDSLFQEARAEWVDQVSKAVSDIEEKFVRRLEASKRELVRSNKLAEAKAYDNVIKGSKMSGEEPAGLKKLREVRAGLINKTIKPINKQYWGRLKKIRKAYQEAGSLEGVSLVDEEIKALLEK